MGISIYACSNDPRTRRCILCREVTPDRVSFTVLESVREHRGSRPRLYRAVVRCGRWAVGPAGTRGAGHRRFRRRTGSDVLGRSNSGRRVRAGRNSRSAPGERRDPGRRNTSDRRVSPAVDEPVLQEHETTAVVSALLELDITPVADAVGSPPTSTAEASSSPSLSPPSAETDVTVPDLSPGDDRAEGQQQGSPDRAVGRRADGAAVERGRAGLRGRGAPEVVFHE